MIIQKVVQEAPEATETFEFFELAKVLDPLGKEISGSRSTGRTTLAQLESQKESLTKQIAILDEKIKAINAL